MGAQGVLTSARAQRVFCRFPEYCRFALVSKSLSLLCAERDRAMKAAGCKGRSDGA
jgi:hypothetical protein